MGDPESPSGAFAAFRNAGRDRIAYPPLMISDDSLSPAERLFDRFLDGVQRGEAPDFEVLVAGHPEQAASLRRLHQNWQLIRALEPDVRPAASPGPGTWDAFLRQLERQAPASARYERGPELARGGMGAIYKVYEESLRRTLAMKVALPRGRREDAQPIDPVTMGRFLEEAQVTAQLDHPGIVPIYELSVNAGGQVFFTMKLVRGENLSEIFRKVKEHAEGFDQTRVLWVLLRACEALAFAHSRGVIHRDLKPANIMVGRFGETYVMDWGVARVLGRADAHDLRLRAEPPRPLEEATRIGSQRKDDGSSDPGSPLVTMDGEVVGTPAYMSPEQAAGKIDQLGPESDVYGMGAILYELFAGHMPYVEPGQRTSSRTVLRWVLDGPPKPIRQIDPGVPPELVAICEKAMAREMSDRYPSMEELAEDLRAYLEQRVVRAHAVGPLAELKKWMLRNKAVAALALILILVVAGLGFGLAWQEKRANRIIAAERDRAESERRRVLRISDARRLEELLSEMDTLWPALPETAPAMRSWLDRARDLESRLPQHEETLAELRSRGTPGPHRLDPDLADFLEHKRKDLAVALGDEFKTEEERRAHVAELDHWILEMRKVMDRERSYSFGDDQDTAWWHGALYELVMGLRDLGKDTQLGPTIRNIEQRLKHAESTLRISFEDHAEEWDLAIASIEDPAECPQYGGLELEPQLGLVPIGRDPSSGLWEFWHIQTGSRPERTKSGELVFTDDCGLVFVLIPGGDTWMGAQRHDPEGPNYDPLTDTYEADLDSDPVEVRLDPFFLSKFEMTQGQWLRIAGENPSYYDERIKRPDLRQHTLLFPVESITWEQASELLERRLRLTLPTEAQWEHACRAGSGTPWWTGSDRESLRGAVNLADHSTAQAGVDWLEDQSWVELDDGYFAIAPVHLFRPNPFGLHNVCGNVWEWVQDSYVHYREPCREGDGLRLLDKKTKVVRGGAFNTTAEQCRSAHRGRLDRTHLSTSVGVRPARGLFPFD